MWYVMNHCDVAIVQGDGMQVVQIVRTFIQKMAECGTAL